MWLYYLQAVLVLAIAILCLNATALHRWAGGTIALVFVAATAISLLAGRGSDWSGLPIYRALLDGLVFAVFLVLWLRADSWWVLLICSAQLLSVAAHMARLMDLPLPPLGYAVMEIWPFWFVIAVTLGSLIANRMRHSRKTSKP